MAIKGKKRYTVYLTEDDAELVKKYMQVKSAACLIGQSRDSLSTYLDNKVRGLADGLRRSGVDRRIASIKQMTREEWFDLIRCLETDEWAEDLALEDASDPEY